VAPDRRLDVREVILNRNYGGSYGTRKGTKDRRSSRIGTFIIGRDGRGVGKKIK